MGREFTKASEESLPLLHEDIIEFIDGALAIRIRGVRGATFNFGDGSHKYDPADDITQDAIVRTKSGNTYFISHDSHGGTYVVNTRETERSGRLVAAYSAGRPTPLPKLEFGRPWSVAELHTSDVTALLLQYKVAEGSPGLGRRVDQPNPFPICKALLRRHRRDG
jgi:hypothetical protein